MKNHTESQNITLHDITRGHEGGSPPPDSPRASCSQRLSLDNQQRAKLIAAEPLRSLRCNWLDIEKWWVPPLPARQALQSKLGARYQCINLPTIPLVGLDWNLASLTIISVGLILLITSWRKQNRTNSFRAMAIAVEQILENSDNSEAIQGVEEEFSLVRKTLEKISQSQDALVPQESLEELLFIYNLYLAIVIEANLVKRYQSLNRLEEILETFKNKYRDFTPEEALNGISHIQIWVKSNIALMRGKTLFIVASQEETEEKQLETFYNGCISLLDIAENYLNFFTEKGRDLIKTMAEILINYQPFNYYASQRPFGELTSTAVGIINAAKAILWEINEYEKKHPLNKRVSWEEEEAFLDMLIEDMEANQNVDAPIEEIEAFNKALGKFIE
jgi:flagellin-specific chaperone FliS